MESEREKNGPPCVRVREPFYFRLACMQVLPRNRELSSNFAFPSCICTVTLTVQTPKWLSEPERRRKFIPTKRPTDRPTNLTDPVRERMASEITWASGQDGCSLLPFLRILSPWLASQGHRPQRTNDESRRITHTNERRRHRLILRNCRK